MKSGILVTIWADPEREDMRLMQQLRVWLGQIFGSIGKSLKHLFQALRFGLKPGTQRLFPSAFVSRAFWGLIAWCGRLDARLFLQGLPALVIGLSCSLVLAFAAFTPNQEIAGRYKERAEAAEKAKDYREALVCYERLADLQNDDEVAYKWALASGSCRQRSPQQGEYHRGGRPRTALPLAHESAREHQAARLSQSPLLASPSAARHLARRRASFAIRVSRATSKIKSPCITCSA